MGHRASHSLELRVDSNIAKNLISLKSLSKPNSRMCNITDLVRVLITLSSFFRI
jgi:hypothetical protein